MHICATRQTISATRIILPAQYGYNIQYVRIYLLLQNLYENISGMEAINAVEFIDVQLNAT